MRCNQLPCGLAARFALIFALLAGNAATGVAQVKGPDADPFAPAASSRPRGELRAETALRGVDAEEAIRAVIRNDKTLLGGESVVPKTRESSQSLEALREQVRDQVKAYEAEIVQIDAGIATLKSLLEAHKKNPGGGNASADYVKGVNQEIARASQMKIRHEAAIAALRTSAAAMADRETALQAQVESERAVLKQLVDQIIRERAVPAKELPPVKDADVKIFSLAHATPLDMAQVVSSIFGPSKVRVSVDDRTNSLIVLGDKESLGVVESLLQKMDQPAESQTKTVRDASAPHSGAERSLSLRIFWLADGLPEGEGQEPEQFLPASVLKAVARLGVDKPRLVVQTATSLAMQEGSQSVKFSTNVPAVLFQQRTGLSCEGTMNATTDDRANVEMRLTAGANGVDCELRGSLATPLGHFMVLGTANSVMHDFATAGRAGPDGMTMGGGMAGMEGGMEMGMGPGDPAMMGAAGPAKFNTSRFAFVVQVIEGESFAPAE